MNQRFRPGGEAYVQFASPEIANAAMVKDREKMGARDQSDEILAADYDQVLKQFNENRKNKNTVSFCFVNG